MPNGMNNLERVKGKRNEYVGYANGEWRVFKRPGTQGWRADKNGSSIYGKTLKDISDQLWDISGRAMSAKLFNPFLTGGKRG